MIKNIGLLSEHSKDMGAYIIGGKFIVYVAKSRARQP